MYGSFSHGNTASQQLAVFFSPGKAFGHFFVEPLIHVASVLGGLLSQEVIKVPGWRLARGSLVGWHILVGWTKNRGMGILLKTPKMDGL